MAAPRRKTDPKNQSERRAEAARLHNAGHITNPLGKTDNRGRRLKPSRANPIGGTGGITDAQLYRFLTEKYDENGWHGVLENELAPFREHVSAQFDALRQKFIDTCGHKPDNRELHEYFGWFLEPERLRKFMSSARRAGRDYPSWPQVLGTVYVRDFYDSVLKRRKSQGARRADADMDRAKDVVEYVRRAFDDMRRVEDDDSETVFCIGRYGMVLYAQFLGDERGKDGSQAKERIISLMARFLQGAADKKLAMDFLQSTEKVTNSNHKLNDDCSIWPQWRETTSDVVRTAIQSSGLQP